MLIYSRATIKILLATLMVASLSACTQVTTKALGNDAPRPESLDKGLTETLNEEQEYELAIDLAGLEIERDNFDRAISILHELRKDSPADVRPYRLLAQIYEKQDKRSLALVAMKQAVTLPSHTIDDESELARLALMEENYALAEEVYNVWLKSTDRSVNVSALNNLGFSLLLQKRYFEAWSFFKRALVLDPLNNRALSNLTLVNSLLK